MKKTIILAVLAIALVAVPAHASVQNVKISGDIDSTWLVRDQFNLGFAAEDFYQNLIISQTRLRVDADLTDNVSATVGILNERAWNSDNNDSEDNDMDLNLAYVTMREMLYSPLTVVIGRQNFSFGNSFIIDSAGTNNSVASGGLNAVAEDMTKSTAQDAVRLTLDYNPLTIDVVASKIASNNSLGNGDSDDDVDLFGINANYNLGDSMETVMESYFWSKIDQSVKDDGLGAEADTTYTFGGRVSTNPIKGLNLQGELAWQRGNESSTFALGNQKREAMAAQVIANYILPFESTAQWSPVVTGVYTFVSGDSNPAEPDTAGGDERHYTAWDPMFENQGGGTIYNTLFNLTNAHIVTLKGEIKPMEDVTLWTSWNGMWLDKRIKDTISPDDGTSTNLTLLQPDGTSIASFAMTSDKKLGDEVGIGAVYDYTEDVQIGARLDWFIPGSAFADTNNRPAFQSLVNANVAF